MKVSGLDPITIEIVANGLRSVADETFIALMKSAYSTNIKERRHEAMATVRLVNKDGDVIWSTTQESTGARFRGASADVADKITRQLLADYDRVKTKAK